ncbi:DUF4843 domain-containing protein [Sphingobacterium alkalisoli]|uniref:DUF4843 domain-containing protein n=1 Tax=Sphingobacterium alkalisoli TaxID=1874115 RepID=A0A4U0GR39_9SPHI|nr:DUF4843 domain-containing protein [Sphingobacterium alkalisoli]TJY61420.1 DUF4843 domain-containing protein [Sphingobacterium alkalisoli]GGH30501.1 hypothetical protein GCM10011418_42590 [Sphingobacterium alkalisoli]
MMKIKNILYTLFVVACFANSCGKEERLMYKDNDPRIYFPKNIVTNGIGSIDSVNLSFALDPEEVQTDTISLAFRIMGAAKAYDRPIKLELTEASTAKMGYHFIAKDLYMPANAYDVEVPIIIFRRHGLKDSVLRAELRIAESEHFKPGYDEPNTSSRLNRLSYNFTITDMLTKPAIWDARWASLFGAYSNTKLVYLTQWTGYRNWNTAVNFPQDRNLLIQQARLGLYEYEQANGPLIDENDNRVILP